jgi:uncharacterized 2Fe-2S/4Fe-4S cluster protein (DUF4445 family)
MSGSSLRVQLPGGGFVPLAEASGNVAERLSRAGHPLNTRCGQRGLCAGCTVHLSEGSVRLASGVTVVAPAEIKACQAFVPPGGSAAVAVPPRSLAAHLPQVVTVFKTKVSAAHQPLPPLLPGVRDHGLAIDIGTTTVVVALVDLTTGQIVREAADFNRQIDLGDNVLTRIQVAGQPAKLEELRLAIIERTIVPLTRAVCAAAGLDPARLAGATIAGNTTMLHLLTGTDPTSLGIAPFRAVFTEHRVMTAAEMGYSAAPPGMPVHLLPGFSAYVGADLVAGCVCTAMSFDQSPSLLVDIGTNGEILLQHGSKIFGAATAAGPAFEGGRLSRGTRAAAGAVSHVKFSGGAFPPTIEIIGGAGPIHGLCGTAYVDFLAEGRRIGLLGPQGRLVEAIWRTLPAEHRHDDCSGRGVFLRPNDPATLVTESDVAHLMQAKAAIAAGILLLLRHVGLQPADVGRLYLAGGFGLHLDPANTIASGLLPGFKPEQLEVVGNTALGGAWLALVDSSLLDEMIAVSATAEIIELNLEPGFEDTFIDQLELPQSRHLRN